MSLATSEPPSLGNAGHCGGFASRGFMRKPWFQPVGAVPGFAQCPPFWPSLKRTLGGIPQATVTCQLQGGRVSRRLLGGSGWGTLKTLKSVHSVGVRVTLQRSIQGDMCSWGRSSRGPLGPQVLGRRRIRLGAGASTGRFLPSENSGQVRKYIHNNLKIIQSKF